jgi:hypothetical protein
MRSNSEYVFSGVYSPKWLSTADVNTIAFRAAPVPAQFKDVTQTAGSMHLGPCHDQVIGLYFGQQTLF